MAEQPSEAASAPIHPQPLGVQHLFDLLVRPSQFFAGQIALGRRPAVAFVAWVVGMSNVLDHASQDLASFAAGPFWLAVMAVGTLSGYLTYRIAGWWYARRVAWCGVIEPDRKLAHHVYIYASFIAAAVSVGISLIGTLRYGTFAAANDASSGVESLIVLVAIVWSVIVSWRGVQAAFPGMRRRATAMWFLVLPSVAYGVVLLVLMTIPGIGTSPALQPGLPNGGSQHNPGRSDPKDEEIKQELIKRGWK
jgi:hypothetical protein